MDLPGVEIRQLGKIYCVGRTDVLIAARPTLYVPVWRESSRLLTIAYMEIFTQV